MPTGRDGRGRWLNNTGQVTVNAAVGGANLLSMSYRRRKRSIRRSRPSLEQDEELQVTEDNDEGVNGLSKEQDGPVESPEDAEKAAREQEIWESFREEHYEVVEQLPLSLQRAYALIRELDQQVHSYNDQLSQSLKSYVDTRNSIAKPVAEAQAVTTDVEEPSADEPGTSSPRRSTRTPAAQSQHSTSNEDSPPSTRELLKRIAQLSEDVMSASYEKLSLARFACDLIDRHNKDLERAIKEQETSLSIGLRPGTHPASIILPDVVVPPATRAPRITHSPIPDDDDYSDQTPAPPDGEVGMDPERELSSTANDKHPRKRSRNRPPKKKGDSVAPSKDKDTPSSPHRPVVRLTLPPLASIAGNIGGGGQPDGVIPDDEPRYCYCHGVSAGEMIACDAEGCKYQWFHMECLNMKEAPPGDFICPDCMQSAVPKPVRKRKRR